MASLVDRLVGTDGDKIAIHAFTAAINELRRGKITGAAMVSMFSLTNAQTTQATALKKLIVAAPNRIEFMRVFKDLLYMGEVGLTADYRSQAFILARLQEEVTDQGGTLP